MRVTSWSSKLIGLFIAVSAVVACDDPAEPPSEDATGDTSNCNIEPTLSSLTENYFKASCVLTSCHKEGAVTKNGGLLLIEGQDISLHDRLVGVTPHNAQAAAAGKVLVKAGDPDNSFMVQKVEGNIDKQRSTSDVREGKWMPDGTNKTIDPECRVKMLRQWIADGALDN